MKDLSSYPDAVLIPITPESINAQEVFSTEEAMILLADAKPIQTKISLVEELNECIREGIESNFNMPQLIPGMAIFHNVDALNCEELSDLIVDHKTFHQFMDLVHLPDSDYADLVKLMEGKGYFESFTTSHSLDGYVCVILGAEKSKNVLAVSWLAFKR